MVKTVPAKLTACLELPVVNGNWFPIWSFICGLSCLRSLTQPSCSSLASFLLCELNSWLPLGRRVSNIHLAVVVSRIRSQNHAIIEPWNGLGQKGHKTHLVPPPCPWTPGRCLVGVSELLWPHDELEAARGTHHESSFFLSCLEAAVAEFGSGVNEFEVDDFVGPAARVHQEGLGKKSHSIRRIITETQESWSHGCRVGISY